MDNPPTSAPDSLAAALAEIVTSQRAVRRLRATSVPRAVIKRLIFLATRAPSGSNRQPWEFVVVTDSHMRKQLGEIYRRASRPNFEMLLEGSADEAGRRLYRDALYLSDHMGEAPVIIVVCAVVSDQRPLQMQLPSIYPAVQNLLLAARANGLGGVLTTTHKRLEAEVAALIGLPSGVETVCLIPVGYPARPEKAFRPIDARRPIDDVLHWERF